MIGRKSILFLVAFLLFGTAWAQEKTRITQLELGGLWGRQNLPYEENPVKRLNLSFSAFHGIHLHPAHAFGVSMGIDTYPTAAIVPFSLGWRGFLGKSRGPRLFGSLDLGYGSAFLEKKVNSDFVSESYFGGIHLRPAVGIRLPAKKGGWALTASLGYKLQDTTFQQGFLGVGFNVPGPSSFWPANANSLPVGYSSMNQTSTRYHSFSVNLGVLW